MNMRWKISATKGRLGSVKEKMFRLVSFERENPSVSSPSPVAVVVSPHEAANSLRNYSLDAELRKAYGLMHHRMFERPR